MALDLIDSSGFEAQDIKDSWLGEMTLFEVAVLVSLRSFGRKIT